MVPIWCRIAAVAGVFVVSSGLASPGSAAASDDFPTDMTSAMNRFELDIELEDWFDGPVELIATDDEHGMWNDAETDAARREFIDWFWARRDDDPRDNENPFEDEFYRRVATANQRFRGFPRGWKSDRGRIWITLGPPSGIRRVSMTSYSYGRCRAPEGSMWTYFTQGMPIQARMGEFYIFFVETRPGQYEICDPSMGGVGAYPVYLRQALEIMQKASVVNRTLELGEDPTTKPSDFIAEAMDSELPAEIMGGGGTVEGVAGVALFPFELAIRDLLFRPDEDRLVAGLRAEVYMDPATGDSDPVSWARQWTMSLTENALSELGSLSLRTAIAVPAPEGDYDVRVRVADTTSAAASTWDGEASVSDGGSALGPLLVGLATVVFSEEEPVIAVIGRKEPTLVTGQATTLLVWARGEGAGTDEISLRLTGEGDQVFDLPVESVNAMGDSVRILVVSTRVDDVLAGRYTLELSSGQETVQTDVDVR